MAAMGDPKAPHAMAATAPIIRLIGLDKSTIPRSRILGPSPDILRGGGRRPPRGPLFRLNRFENAPMVG